MSHSGVNLLPNILYQLQSIEAGKAFLSFEWRCIEICEAT